MTVTRCWIPLLALALSVGCSGSQAQEEQSGRTPAKGSAKAHAHVAPAAGAPEVEPPYQEAINGAWAEALGGEKPTNSCAAIKGRAIGSGDSEGARRALYACTIDIPARYFQTVLAQVESGEKDCQSFMMEVMIQLPAMTMDLSGFERLLDQAAVSDEEAAGAAAGLVASAFGGTREGSRDPQKLIKERIATRTEEVCPDIAVVLRP
jgi:hypothetical protein